MKRPYDEIFESQAGNQPPKPNGPTIFGTIVAAIGVAAVVVTVLACLVSCGPVYRTL